MAKLLQTKRDGVCSSCETRLEIGSSAYWSQAERTLTCTACYSATEVRPAARFRPAAIAVSTSLASALPPPSPLLVTQTVPAWPSPSPSPSPAPLAATQPPPPKRPPAPPPGATVPPVPPAAITLENRPVDVAGWSAQREYDRRSAKELARKESKIEQDAKWREDIKQQRPILGRIVAATTPRPQIGPESQSTTAWKVGAEGERRVAEIVDQIAGAEALHDRLMPGSRAANVDHIAVTPSGVYVIDAKKYTGRLEERNVGGVFRPDLRLYVNGRDRTKLAAGVTSQVEAVRDLLASVPGFANVHVGGVLCFIGCDWAKLRTFTINGVTAIWPRGLSEYLNGCTDQAVDVASVAAHLSTTLKQPTR
jgi:Nuclease-related domain